MPDPPKAKFSFRFAFDPREYRAHPDAVERRIRAAAERELRRLRARLQDGKLQPESYRPHERPSPSENKP